MLHKINEAPIQDLEAFMRAVGAVVVKQGGMLEIPFGEMDTVSGGLVVKVDGDREVVILQVLTDKEMAQVEALVESRFQEKH
jgi:hypothetical protein